MKTLIMIRMEINHQYRQITIFHPLCKVAETGQRVPIHQDKEIALCKFFIIKLMDRDLLLEPVKIFRKIILIEGSRSYSVYFQPAAERHLGSDTVAVGTYMRHDSQWLYFLIFWIDSLSITL